MSQNRKKNEDHRVGESWKSPQGRVMWNVNPATYVGIYHVEAGSYKEAQSKAREFRSLMKDTASTETETNYLIKDPRRGRLYIYKKAHPPQRWLPTKKFAAYSRKNPNESERLFKECLDQAKKTWLQGYSYKFQKAIHKYTVDFYFPKRKLAVEVDGESHNDKKYDDYNRDRFLNDLGIAVVRIPKEWVLTDIGKAERKVRNALLGKVA